MKKVLVMATTLAFIFAAGNSYACGQKGESGSKASKAETTVPQAGVKAANASEQASAAQPAATAQGAEKAKVMTTESKNSCPYMKDAGKKASADGGCCVPRSSQTMKAMDGYKGHDSSAKTNAVIPARAVKSQKNNSGSVSNDSPSNTSESMAVNSK